MSDLDAVKESLDSASSKTAEAQQAAGHAKETLQNKTEEIAGYGLDGVAATLSSSHETMEQAVGLLDTAHGKAEEAVTSLKEVTDKTQVSQILAALAAAIGTLADCLSDVQGASAKIEEATGFAQQSEVEPAIDACDHPTRAVSEAQAAVTTAHTTMTEYRGKLEAAAAGN